MSRYNALPKLSITALILSILYFAFIAMHARPMPADLGDRIDWDLVMMEIVAPAAIILNVLVGAFRSARAKEYIWLVAMLVFFPLSFWYTLFVNRGTGAEDSTKANPLRWPA